MIEPLPLMILAGSDGKPGVVPPGMRASDMLGGFKGTSCLPWGRTLVNEAIGRARDSHCFDEILVVGPAEVYAGKLDAPLIHARGSLAQTLSSLFASLDERFEATRPIAFTSCDILPTPEEWRRLMSEHYAPHRAASLWWQLVRASAQEMGASGWKPCYRLRPATDQPSEHFYPGHVLVARCEALRSRLLVHLLALAYQYRNVPLNRRVLQLLPRGLYLLFLEDIRNLSAGQWPVLTCGLPLRGIWNYLRYRRGQMTISDVESFLARVLLHRRFRSTSEARPVTISLIDDCSFAQDIDTQAELNQVTQVDAET